MNNTQNNGTIKAEDRNRVIVRTGIIAILCNLGLSLMKILIGTVTHSIAITLDAVNNITDAGSSVITIAGTRLAAKRPDKQHPFGHGRMEYLTAMLIGAVVMAAGISSLIEAIRKIIRPDVPDYTLVPLILVAVGILVKIFLGRYVTAKGRSVNSEALVNSGKDAAMDALISSTTLAAALIFVFTGLSIEAWLGAAISAFIIKSGLDMVINTISELLGQRVSAEYAKAVVQTVKAFPEVHGVSDVMFNDYGPDRMTGSLHIEVNDMMRAYEITDLQHRITDRVLQEHNLILTAISVYSANSETEEAKQLKNELKQIISGYEHILQMHGFYLKDDSLHFDLLIGFGEKEPEKLCEEVAEKIREKHSELTVHADWDADYSFSE